jgi:hypothetical protein
MNCGKLPRETLAGISDSFFRSKTWGCGLYFVKR